MLLYLILFAYVISDSTKIPTAKPSDGGDGGRSVVPSVTDSPVANPTNITIDTTTIAFPSALGSGMPTVGPNQESTDEPAAGTDEPTTGPTAVPSNRPTKSPTRSPTKSPSRLPTKTPTRLPSGEPSEEPSSNPTNNNAQSPTVSNAQPTDKNPEIKFIVIVTIVGSSAVFSTFFVYFLYKFAILLFRNKDGNFSSDIVGGDNNNVELGEDTNKKEENEIATPGGLVRDINKNEENNDSSDLYEVVETKINEEIVYYDASEGSSEDMYNNNNNAISSQNITIE